MLKHQMIDAGRWLFRWRSILPLALLPAAAAAMAQFTFIGGSHAVEHAYGGVCLAVSLLGQSMRVLTVGFAPHGTSGRNTRRQKAERLNTTGAYSIVRHPLYLANFIILLGILMFTGAWWLVLGASLAYWIYYERIMLAEEEFLLERHGEAFTAWASRTPAFLPDPRRFTRPDLPFSWRSAIRREHSTILLIALAFLAVEVVGDYVVEGRVMFDRPYVDIAIVGAAYFAVVQVLKKTTTLLNAPGR
jgi:protein-S-isoprenylcysteine O-methyltransferase Ste14